MNTNARFSRLLTDYGITHGFGTAREAVPAFLEQEWKENAPIWKQVHGVLSREIKFSRENAGETDALWTRVPGQWVGVLSADCVPILVAHRNGSRVGAIHSGWRGTRGRITAHFLEGWKNDGVELSECIAAIGPSIRGCCYEVSPELVDLFNESFQNMPKKPWLRGERHIDLASIIQVELERVGVRQVDLLPECTACAEDPLGKVFQSYRRDHAEKRQYSVIKTKG